MRRDKYNTKLDGLEVCNACYVMALGYSQRRFKQLESGTQSVRESGSRTWEHVQFEGASKDVGNQGKFYSIRRKRGMYTIPSPSTEEGGQLYSAVDFIVHKHHEGGCVPFYK
jgi:hypothetical protein